MELGEDGGASSWPLQRMQLPWKLKPGFVGFVLCLRVVIDVSFGELEKISLL